MVKRMLIDDTQPEETRVVIINGNKIEDVEFETTSRKQIKGNIYLAKVMRVEPSLQAAFVDYGGNRHGFLAFSEIHPDYYYVSQETLDEVDKEVDDYIEAKKIAIKEREAERERIRAEKALRRAERLKAEEEAAERNAETQSNSDTLSSEDNPVASSDLPSQNEIPHENTLNDVDSSSQTSESSSASVSDVDISDEQNFNNSPSLDDKESNPDENFDDMSLKNSDTSEITVSDETSDNVSSKPRRRFRRKKSSHQRNKNLKVLAETSTPDPSVSEDVSDEDCDVEEEVGLSQSSDFDTSEKSLDTKPSDEDISSSEEDDDDEDIENDFELQRKLLKVRKLYHRSSIQDVIKEGQMLLVQVVKEERGNKGAALTTYLSLAGRYCVLMPNRIKSGGVSRKITNVTDRKRLKAIVKELPLTADMSMIVRTAGEDKTKSDIVRDYNYLIRTWNNIRIAALKSKAPALIHEEGNLIKRALRDMFSKDVSEIIVDGTEAFKSARNFMKILAPQNLKKIKSTRKNDIPLFQRFQVESQLDKLHDTNVQLESGGYLVINPTEALVSIDVNSGRATKEKDLEETALKTNLEAADEIARQLRMRNLAGLVVVDFIDMEDPKNNLAIEKRMKEAMKDDRARVQIAKMSCFGLLEISRQRMHSSFMESNYKVCPYCHGKGMVRTIESSCVLILRTIEEEGIKNKTSTLNVFVPSDVAVYLLNQKRQAIVDLEKRYNLSVIISADNSIKNVEEFRLEKIKNTKPAVKEEKIPEFHEMFAEEEINDEVISEDNDEEICDDVSSQEDTEENNQQRIRRDKRNRYDRRNNRNKRSAHNNRETQNNHDNTTNKNESASTHSEPVILYSSHEDIVENANDEKDNKKSTWWRKLIS